MTTMTNAKTARSFPAYLPAGAVVTAICALGIFLRLLLSPLEGYGFDVGVNQGWAKSAVKLGLARSYSEQVDGNMLPNYPPLSLMVFASTGHLYQAFVSPEYDKGLVENRVFIKFPSILADIVTVVLLFLIVAKWKGKKAGYIAAAVYALHPAVIYDSAVWGQTDSLYTMFLVACVGALSMQWNAAAGALIALAFLTKTQAVILVPFVGFVLLMRGWKAIWQSALAAAVVAILILIPFVPDDGLGGIAKMYADSVGYYPTVASNAYNFWWALLSDSANNVTDNQLIFGVMPYRSAGLMLFSYAYLWVLSHAWKHRRDLASAEQAIPRLFFSSAVLAYAFFLFNTEMHERYLFPFVALAVPMLFLSRKSAWTYAGAGFLFFWNLLGVLPATAVDKAMYATFPALDVFFACMLTFLFPVFVGLRHQLPRKAQPHGIAAAIRKHALTAWSYAKAKTSAPRVP